MIDKPQSQTSEFVGENIVKIVNKGGKPFGTGFFIEMNRKKYCITCHHCIYKIDEIFIEKDGVKYASQWNEKYSDMAKDLAVLDVIKCPIANLLYILEAPGGVSVTLWGFSSET